MKRRTTRFTFLFLLAFLWKTLVALVITTTRTRTKSVGSYLPFLLSTNTRTRTTSLSSSSYSYHHKKRQKEALTWSILRSSSSSSSNSGSDNQQKIQKNGEVGSGPNWIERSFPVNTNDSSDKLDPNTVLDYDLGISGVSYQTGSLSKRLFDVIESKSSLLKNAATAPEIRRGFLIYTMDATAKEAVRAALKRNGLELQLTDEQEEEGLWGSVDSIQLLLKNDDNNNQGGIPTAGKRMFDSLEEAVVEGGWTPGQDFSFVVRQVPAKLRELSLDELLQALDPEGELRQQAKQAGMRLPDEDIQTLKDMANDNLQRTEMAPHGAVSEEEAFAGNPERRGYQVMNVRDLIDPTIMIAEDDVKEHVLMHVMDAMVNHGCLIVDLTNGGTTFEYAKIMAGMWEATDYFYNTLSLPERLEQIPSLRTASASTDSGGVGSPHAKIGFASYHQDNMQFLETRLKRQEQQQDDDKKQGEESKSLLLPNEVNEVLGKERCQFLVQSFQEIMAPIGKKLVQIVTAASILEAGATSNRIDAFQKATLVANELVDDGSSTRRWNHNTNDPNSNDFPPETSVSMSPHRLCLYSNNNQPQSEQTGVEKEKEGKNKKNTKNNNDSPTSSKTREIFGAHTDSTFITAVPVAAISGLEVYDEEAGLWYRPEKAARNHHLRRASPETTNDDDDDIPWYAWYIVFLPGELLQLCSRNEVLATVHRVVATQPPQHTETTAPSSPRRRLSAPVLLRGRLNVQFDCSKYFGCDNDLTSPTDSVLRECHGMTMDQVYNAMQPTSYQ